MPANGLQPCKTYPWYDTLMISCCQPRHSRIRLALANNKAAGILRPLLKIAAALRNEAAEPKLPHHEAKKNGDGVRCDCSCKLACFFGRVSRICISKPYLIARKMCSFRVAHFMQNQRKSSQFGSHLVEIK